MAAEDLFHQVKHRWDEETLYAEILRGRRKLFTTGLALVAGLGVFRLDPLVGASNVYAVPSPSVRFLIASLIIVALGAFVIGGFLLYTRGPSSEEEREAMQEATGISPEEAAKARPPRACEYLTLNRENEEALVAAEGGAEWMIRAKNLQVATRNLAAANRRVSNRIRNAGVAIAGGYAVLAFAVGLYTVSAHG